MLKIQNLTFEYIKNVKVFENFNMIFSEGLNIVFAKRGEGKTALLDFMLFPKRGQEVVKLLGKSVTKETAKNEFSAIHSDWFLKENKTAMENFQVSKYDCIANWEFFLSVGLANFMDKKVSELTKNEKFQLAVMRALKKCPSVLFLDNPFENANGEELVLVLEDIIVKYKIHHKKPLCVVLLSRPFNAGEKQVSLLHGGKIIAKEAWQNTQHQPKTTEVALNFAKYPNNVFAKNESNYYVDGDKVEIGNKYSGVISQINNDIMTVSFSEADLDMKIIQNYKVGDTITIDIKNEGIIPLGK